MKVVQPNISGGLDEWIRPLIFMYTNKPRNLSKLTLPPAQPWEPQEGEWFMGILANINISLYSTPLLYERKKMGIFNSAWVEHTH